jgi:hypothetical protein
MDTETADAGFLNARQEAFCREFVVGGSAVAAARAAGYAETTARAQAARLLQHPHIQDRIEQLRADEDGAKAALCGRLLQDAHAIRERAIENGDDSMALRAINTTLRVVRQLGMPATPTDTQDVLLDSAHAEAEAETRAPEGADGEAGPAPDAEAASPAQPATDADALDAAIAEGDIDPTSDAALARELAGPYGDRLAQMLASVGECRSNAPANAPTSATTRPPP